MKTSNKILLSTQLIFLFGFIGFLCALRANFTEAVEITDFGASRTINYNNIEPFEWLSVDANCKVELVPGEGFVTIETFENIQDYVKCEVKDGKLRIGEGTNFNSEKKPPIHVKIGIGEKLEKMEFLGVCEVSSSEILDIADLEIRAYGSVNANLQINATLINARTNGASNLTLSGTTQKLEARSTASGNIYAKDLVTAIANVRADDAALMELNVSELLEVNANGAANVRYKGSPVLKSRARDAASVSEMK